MAACALLWHVAHVGRWVWRLNRATNRHGELLRVLASPDPGMGVDTLVLDTSERAVYCLPSRSVVITTGALSALTRTELAAVLAHERAHLRGHHHALRTFARVLHRAVPGVRLFAAADTELGVLLELCADEAAARSHPPRALLGALLAMLGGPVPHSALGAADTAVLERASRLTRRRLSGWHRVAATAVAAAPVVFAVLGLVVLFVSCSPSIV